VVGWKAVHKHNGELIGNKQDKAGRSRKAKVLDYANDQRRAYAIDEDESSWPVGSVSESSRYDHEGENLASRVGHTGDPIDGD
jgi:hypothetical protein